MQDSPEKREDFFKGFLDYAKENPRYVLTALGVLAGLIGSYYIYIKRNNKVLSIASSQKTEKIIGIDEGETEMHDPQAQERKGTINDSLTSVNTLVFEGGSVKGLAYVGALQALDMYSKEKQQMPVLKNVQHVAGTSAGSIMALLIALGLDLDQINIVMRETSFASFADMSYYASYGGTAGKGAALYRNGYLCEGAEFMKWVKGLLRKHAGDENITFAQLKAKTGKDLHVYATRLNDGQIVNFNADQTPNASVALAVRMSMSIPVFFKPVRVKEEYNDQGHVSNVTLDEANGTSYYVDGGVKANYPYQLIKESKKLEDKEILGFKVDSKKEIFDTAAAQGAGNYLKPLVRNQNEIKSGYGIHLIPYMFNALMSPQDDAHRKNSPEYSRTIYCWDCDVSTFDFNLKQPQVEGLLASGASAAHNFIEKTYHSEIPDKKEEKIKDQVENATKYTPKEQVEFTKEYKREEATRLQLVLKDKKEENIDSLSTSELAERKEYIQNLSSDMKKITSTILVQGKAGDINTEIGNVTNVNPEDFENTAKHVLSVVQEGISQKTHVTSGAQAGEIKTSIANINMRSLGFFGALDDGQFITDASNILEELERNKTLYSSNAINNLCENLKNDIEEFKGYKTTVFKNKLLIQGMDSSKQAIVEKTKQLKQEKVKIDKLEAEKKISPASTLQAPAAY